jgi:hypothetical protein
VGAVPLDAADPGDIVFMHGSDLVGRAIRLAERIRFHSGATYNHVAILDADTAVGWTVIQAGGRGVTRGALLPADHYMIVTLPPGVDRTDVLAFARAQVGVRYGFIDIASILFNLLTPRAIRIDIRRDGTLICSALGALSLLAGGWLHPIRDYYQCSPAELSEALA